MTSSGKIGLNIRTNASPKWDKTKFVIKDTTENIAYASYLDLQLSILGESQLHNSIYVKQNDFSFHITSFPFMKSNIPSSPAATYTIARTCSSYKYFILRARRFFSKLFNKEYIDIVERLRSAFRKFYGRYSRMFNVILKLDQLQ